MGVSATDMHGLPDVRWCLEAGLRQLSRVSTEERTSIPKPCRPGDQLGTTRGARSRTSRARLHNFIARAARHRRQRPLPRPVAPHPPAPRRADHTGRHSSDSSRALRRHATRRPEQATTRPISRKTRHPVAAPSSPSAPPCPTAGSRSSTSGLTPLGPSQTPAPRLPNQDEPNSETPETTRSRPIAMIRRDPVNFSPAVSGTALGGGDEGIRTPDPFDANEVRYRTALHPRGLDQISKLLAVLAPSIHSPLSPQPPAGAAPRTDRTAHPPAGPRGR